MFFIYFTHMYNAYELSKKSIVSLDETSCTPGPVAEKGVDREGGVLVLVTVVVMTLILHNTQRSWSNGITDFHRQKFGLVVSKE